MRQNRPYGLEGGESGSTGLPYPYRGTGGYGVFTPRMSLPTMNSADWGFARGSYQRAYQRDRM